MTLKRNQSWKSVTLKGKTSEKTSQSIVSSDMTTLAQSNLEHGQENISSDIEHVNLPVDHVDSINKQQGSMAPPTAFSSDQLIDPQMSLDPQFLVPIEDSVGSDPTKSTHLTSKYNDTSLVLPSTEDNSDSLIKTEEFLEFVDELSQEPPPLSDREGTSSQDDTVLLSRLKKIHTQIMLLIKLLRVLIAQLKNQDFSIVKVPKGNDVESTDISITESQFSSTMLYCEESLVAKLDPLGESQFLSAQPCHKEDTTFPHESANLFTEERELQMIALKIVLLVLLLARSLQKLPMSSLILFLTIILNLKLILVICSPVKF